MVIWVITSLILILILKQKFIRYINEKYKENRSENRPYYFFSDMVNIKDFDLSLLDIDKLSYKSANINI